MKGRDGKGPPSTDLLVCFPSRAHLTLMPKPICSPARPSESSKRQHNHQHHHAKHLHRHHHPHLKKSSNRSGAAGQASPLLWAKTKPISKDISEPTSPKVTCAGQIKVRSKPASSCKNWQSVMEEIERLHKNRKHKKRAAWSEALGFKKDVMQFLTCLRNIRFDFRCFGSFPTSGITSDDDEDEEDDDEDYQEPRISREASDDNETSRTVFSKWFMVLQENNNKDTKKGNKAKERSHNEEAIEAPCAPPPNALLLMRCRSAPAKSWLQERDEVEEEEEDEEEESNDDEDGKQKKENEKKAKQAMEEEKKKKENLVVMRYGTDFNKFSSDIAKETWVVGGVRDPLSRSRSWKR